MVKECITHHYGCDCRERALKELLDAVALCFDDMGEISHYIAGGSKALLRTAYDHFRPDDVLEYTNETALADIKRMDSQV